MTTSEVRDEADAPAPEVLEAAPRSVDRRLVRALVAAAVVAVLAVAGLAVWQKLQPPPDFTLAQLQGAYTGMVRSDGTNDVSTIDPSRFPEPPLRISPEACTPLFVSTISNQFPPAALDGVSTYWLGGASSSISLFTVRYADADAAEAAFRVVGDASTGCAGQTVTFSGTEGSGRVEEVPVTAPADAPEQLAFALDRGRGQGRYALHVLRLSNTVTWQYRYDTSPGPYDAIPAQQLMNGVSRQLLSVQQAAAAAR
ncbi:hypothetical protein SAMN04488543_2392 [Friedmanniella luteola]|uniref:PknH-like extracellular domain-containing protein n=1 Tax=Friedmanniella luteola TaxID=546871 RepID=A0A1H1V3X3_9ACTN|nr:hypothetical protein [Friedmanniella luteola]SDS79432.1 hypothetical protein SAMN04488543_2392 [Friedmanniella luteola]